MTPKYWLRIVAGMLAIFAVGMIINMGIREGHRKVEQIVEGTGPITLPLLGMAFRLDGEQLGGIHRLQLLRSHPKVIDSAVVIVDLKDTTFLHRFDDCRLTVRDAHNLSDKSSFFCADSATAAELDLEPFGHVVFRPSGRNVVIWMPRDVVSEIREQQVDGDLATDSTDVNIGGDEQGLTVRVNGREVVRIEGDSAGGRLVVRDSTGRTVVSIGDSTRP